jgi:hypothetical protein
MKRVAKKLFGNVDQSQMLPKSAASFFRQRVEAGLEFYIKNFWIAGLNELLS